MVHKFDQFSNDSEMVSIFSSNGSKAYYGQDEMDHFGTFLPVTSLSEYSAFGGPVLVYDWADSSKEFISKIRGSANCIYNDFRDMKLGKLSVLKKLVADGVDWLPRTAFTADEGWSGVKFPAICKAANSYDSKGVEKIDCKRNVPDYIDIVQDLIPIDREFRVIAFRGKSNGRVQLIQLLEKTPKNDKAKDLRTNESLSKADMKNKPNTKFTWSILNPADESALIPDISKIVKYIFNDNKGLNFAGFDIAFDKECKGWYIEHNIIPAPVGPMFLLLYKAMFEDWYHRPVGPAMSKLINNLSQKYSANTNGKIDLKVTSANPDMIDL